MIKVVLFRPKTSKQNHLILTFDGSNYNSKEALDIYNERREEFRLLCHMKGWPVIDSSDNQLSLLIMGMSEESVRNFLTKTKTYTAFSHKNHEPILIHKKVKFL